MGIKPNNKTIRATFYRGIGNDQEQQYGPVIVNVVPVSFMVKPEKTIATGTNYAIGQDFVTHRIFIDLPKLVQETDVNGNPVFDAFNNPVMVKPYEPILDDIIVISGSSEGGLDGEYVVKQYPRIYIARNKRFNSVELASRFLGVKKLGDTSKMDNSQNVRLGIRSHVTSIPQTDLNNSNGF
jgi:hypothetical protein